MSSAQDPFYIVKDEVQESIDSLVVSFNQWQHISPATGDQAYLTKELLSACESIEWQVDELDKAIAVAARDPDWYHIEEVELENRKRWTSTAREQVGSVKKTVLSAKEHGNKANKEHRDLVSQSSHQLDRYHQYGAHDDSDFIASESEKQMLLIRRQDEELDQLSASVARIGDVGLTIHEELTAQERIIEELDVDMESTSNRLDFIQKRIAMVMKKAGSKGPCMMIIFLLILFIILFILVFLT